MVINQEKTRKKKKTIVLTEEIIKIGEKYAKQYGLNFSTMVEMVLRGKLEPPLKEKKTEIKLPF